MYQTRRHVIVILLLVLPVFPIPASASTILAGDLFLASHAGFYNVPGGGLVDFAGSAFAEGPGNADTHLILLESVPLPGVGGTATLDTQLVRLEAASIAPVAIGGRLFDFFISLTEGTESFGFIEIEVSSLTDDGPAPEGTWTNHFEINFIVDFTPTDGGSGAFSISDTIFIESVSPGFWSLDPPEPGNCNTTNFFTIGEMPMLDAATGNGGIHSPCKFSTPEPTPLMLVGIGAFAWLLSTALRRRRPVAQSGRRARTLQK